MTRAASSESPVARRILIGVGLLFLALFLALPLVVVFVQAFA
jgi:sulfate transport system permease protein